MKTPNNHKSPEERPTPDYTEICKEVFIVIGSGAVLGYVISLFVF